MRLSAPEISQPVFHFLDGLIRDYGDILFMLFAYAAIPLLIWVLCGGLRRKLLAGKCAPNVLPVTVIYLPLGWPRPPSEPLPPIFGQDCKPHCCEYDDDCVHD